MFIVFITHGSITQENFHSLLGNERDEESDDTKDSGQTDPESSHQLKKDCQDTTPTFSSSSNKKKSHTEHGVKDISNKDARRLECFTMFRCITVCGS